MRKELGMVLSAAALAVALPQAARAAEAQAPPTLTPAVAQQVAAACPEAAYTDVAARRGAAWITAQRPVPATAARGRACSAPSYSFDWQNQHGMSGRNTRTSAPTVVSSPSGSEPALQPSETRPGGR